MKAVPLLDYFQWKLQCEYLSDLHWLRDDQRKRLAREVEKLRAADASLHEWNDALEYLLGHAPEPTAEAARDTLLAGLNAQEEGYYAGTQTGNRNAAAIDAGGAVSK